MMIHCSNENDDDDVGKTHKQKDTVDSVAASTWNATVQVQLVSHPTDNTHGIGRFTVSGPDFAATSATKERFEILYLSDISRQRN